MRARMAMLVALLLALVVLLGGCATTTPPPAASKVLYYYDTFYPGTEDVFVRDALDANGYDVTETTVTAEFDLELAGGTYDLVIALSQNNGPAYDVAALIAYVDGGGRAIVADYGRTTAIAQAFDGAYTGNTNATTADLLEPELATYVTDPMTLVNPGWSVFSMGLAPGADGVSLCTFETTESCLVEGNGGRTLLLGLLADAVPAADGQPFWQNVTAYLLP